MEKSEQILTSVKMVLAHFGIRNSTIQPEFLATENKRIIH